MTTTITMMRKTAGVLAALAMLATPLAAAVAPATAFAAPAGTITLTPDSGSDTYAQGDALNSTSVTLASTEDETDLSTSFSLKDSSDTDVAFDTVFSSFELQTGSDGPYDMAAANPGQSTFAYGPASYPLSSTSPQTTVMTGGIKADAPAGTYTITVTVSQAGTPAATGTYDVTVTPSSTNHAPTATAQTVDTDQDTAAAITLAGTDADGDAMTFATTSSPTHGTLSGTAPDLTYTPDAGYTGTDSFDFTASDASSTSSPATVTINVNSTGGGTGGGTPPSTTTVTVTPNNTQGWATYGLTAGGDVSYVADVDAPGGSALELTTSDDASSVTHYKHTADVALSDVSAISYETKQLSAADATNGNATLRISLNLEGTSDTEDEQLMYEPYYNGFAGGSGWNTWDISSTSGKFWSNYGVTYGAGKGGVSAGSYASNFTIADVLAQHPNAKVLGLILSMGDSNPSQQILVDDVTLTSSSDSTMYDFNQNPVVTPPACDTGDNSTFDGFALGSVNGQNGWSATGPYDQAIVDNTYGYDSFGCKSLRVSDATTSGSFGDWVLTPPVADAVGESDTTGGATDNDEFDMQFDIAAATATAQPGSEVSVAPTDTDGARMSYLRFEDSATGINVFFDDVTATGPMGSSTPFNETQIATNLDRTVPHAVELKLDVVSGASNDVVNVYIDGNLVHTGTSWENYYRFDPESQGTPHDTTLENMSRTVDRMIIQARGTAHPADDGNGFLFDNVNLSSSNTSDDNSGGGGGGGHHSSHSGGGGGTVTTTTGNTGGQVLGAATYNFTRDLTIGSTGPDVTALQQYLIAAGFSIPAGATGYFGAQTQSALAAFQSAHNIYPPAGYFGPITRAYIMAHGVAGTGLSDAQRAAILAELADILKQALQIQAEIDAMK